MLRMSMQLPRMGSEYGDDVTKSNKKEDMMLARQLRVLERQERIAGNIIRKTIREAESLKCCVTDHTCLAPDLRHYDLRKYLAKASRYGAPQSFGRKLENGRRAGVTLPPIRDRSHSFSGPDRRENRKERRSHTLPNIHHAERAALTMRQLRQTVTSPGKMAAVEERQQQQQQQDTLKTLEWKEKFFQKLEKDMAEPTDCVQTELEENTS